MRWMKTWLVVGLILAFATAGPGLAQTKLKVGFIYVGPIGDYGWTHAHNQARLIAEKTLPIETLYVEAARQGQALPEHPLRARQRLQAQPEHVHLHGRFLPDLLPERSDGWRADQNRQGGLRGRLPDPRGEATPRRVCPRRAGGQPQGPGQCALAVCLV